MRVAFYAPLKSPDHPVPSGDRLMARLLIAALEKAGHSVEVASELRSFTPVPDSAARAVISEHAKTERQRLLDRWRQDGPDLWLTYHTYYKAPDEVGPAVASALDIPYVTAEASYSGKRDRQGWAENQRLVTDAVRQAAVNLCFTERDRLGLIDAVPQARFASFPPFIDVEPFQALPELAPRRLVTVAMMRAGDKFDSYVMLAKALERIHDRNWTLTVIGDGPIAGEVKALFRQFPPEQVSFPGQLSPQQIAVEFRKGGTYVWPGCGEAYGLAYLEAQAAGLPVIAQATAGVPAVVLDGRTGVLTSDGDIEAFAVAILSLLDDPARHASMGAAARSFVQGERSLAGASRRLAEILQHYLGERYDR